MPVFAIMPSETGWLRHRQNRPFIETQIRRYHLPVTTQAAGKGKEISDGKTKTEWEIGSITEETHAGSPRLPVCDGSHAADAGNGDESAGDTLYCSTYKWNILLS